MDLTHDFNNILTGILSLSQSYLSQTGPEHPFHEGLGLISQNARQASQLLHRIIHLHQDRTGQQNYHDLNEITSESVELLRKVIPRRIEVTIELEGTSLPLYVDAVEFRQTIINLAMNAADAMPARGKLLFRTSLHQEMPALENFQGVMPRLPSACLLVADNGSGIKAHQLRSIFDPFFTTKAMNKGSGLGLYNAKLFVEKHHGAISVKSTEAGTDFGVWLPIANFAEAEQAQELSNQRQRTILLVGQTGKSSDGMAEFLRLHNYHVVAVARGAEELLQANEDNFDGLMVQVEAKETGNLSLIDVARRLQLPLKTMVQIIGCNQDELETESLLKADLLISADMSQESILKELVAMFESRG
jgi:hypothetical protein